MPGWVSLLPAFTAIAIALIIRSVVPALLLGIWLGATALHSFSPKGAGLGLLDSFQVFVANAVADVDHAAIILFTMMIGGMVGIITRNGGMMSIVKMVVSRAKTAVGAQVAAWLGEASGAGGERQQLVDKLRRLRGGRPSRRTTRCPFEVPRIVRGAVDLVVRLAITCIDGEVRLPENDRSRLLDPCHRCSVELGDVVGELGCARGGDAPLGLERVLDRDRHPVQRAQLVAACDRLVGRCALAARRRDLGQPVRDRGTDCPGRFPHARV